jgi:hypothetical protein
MISVIIADPCRRHGKANKQYRHKNQSSADEVRVCFVLLTVERCLGAGEGSCSN